MRTKIKIILIGLLVLLALSACSGKVLVPLETETAPNKPSDFNPDTSDAIATLKESLKNKDADSFKSLFSKTTVSEVSDLDTQIQALFDYVGDVVDVYAAGGDDDTYAEGGGKTPEGYVLNREHFFKIKTEKKEFALNFLEIVVDSQNNDNLRFVCVYVKPTDAVNPVFEGDADGTQYLPGIHLAKSN